MLPPARTPRDLLEPIGKKYVLTAELTDNSLDSDNLCFQVNTSEEIRTSVGEPSISANTAGSPISTVSGAATPSNPPAPATSSTNDAIYTPPDGTIADIADKVKSVGANKKRETTPPSQTGGKKVKDAKATAAKQLSFDDDQASSETPRFRIYL